MSDSDYSTCLISSTWVVCNSESFDFYFIIHAEAQYFDRKDLIAFFPAFYQKSWTHLKTEKSSWCNGWRTALRRRGKQVRTPMALLRSLGKGMNPLRPPLGRGLSKLKVIEISPYYCFITVRFIVPWIPQRIEGIIYISSCGTAGTDFPNSLSQCLSFIASGRCFRQKSVSVLSRCR